MSRARALEDFGIEGFWIAGHMGMSSILRAEACRQSQSQSQSRFCDDRTVHISTAPYVQYLRISSHSCCSTLVCVPRGFR